MLLESFVSLAADYSLWEEALRETGPQFGTPLVESPALLFVAGAAAWEIKSDSVKLDEHVGHTIKIVGVVSNATAHGMKEDTKEEMKEHGMDKHATESGHMTVTHLTLYLIFYLRSRYGCLGNGSRL